MGTEWIWNYKIDKNNAVVSVLRLQNQIVQSQYLVLSKILFLTCFCAAVIISRGAN